MGAAQNISDIPKEGIKDVVEFPQDKPLPLYFLPHHYSDIWANQKEVLSFLAEKKFKSIEEIPEAL